MSMYQRKYGRVILSICIVLVISVSVYAACMELFTIETIEVVGGSATVKVDESKLPKNLLFFPSEAMKLEILRNNPILSTIEFQKKFPHTLVIRPVIRSASGILMSSGSAALIDKTGVVLMYGDQGLSLPEFYFDVPVLRVGEILNVKKLTVALSVFEEINALSRISLIKEIEGEGIFIQTEKTGIFITQDSRTDQTITTLQTLFEGFRIKGTLPRVVDLRFDKPVVQF